MNFEFCGGILNACINLNYGTLSSKPLPRDGLVGKDPKTLKLIISGDLYTMPPEKVSVSRGHYILNIALSNIAYMSGLHWPHRQMIKSGLLQKADI